MNALVLTPLASRSIFHTPPVINPRTGEEYRGAVFVPDCDGYADSGTWSRVHCDQWSWRAEMYSLAGEDVFEVEGGGTE